MSETNSAALSPILDAGSPIHPSKPIPEPALEPAQEQVTEPNSEPAPEPAQGQVTEPNSEPAPEPAQEQVTEPNSEPAPEPESELSPELDMSSVIKATPITTVAPGETLPPPKRKRMDPDEMAKRPSWLPDNWRMEVKVRTSGSTAGLIDRYYYEPEHGTRFRSKIEVMNYLKTGIAPKGKKSNSKTSPKEDAATPSESPASVKQKKRKAKGETDAGADAAGAAAEGADVEASGSQKQKKSSTKRKKSEAA